MCVALSVGQQIQEAEQISDCSHNPVYGVQQTEEEG